ncbi:hypothetical protein AVEN_22485-1 [Araneus ventricosus]|uniref:Uncharacterized protein n=1 Tax=Araneus ventricosus TaxID=182803 RepID=A0A4Y2P184_ARAVE|nr:hypothetical protein AVEN_22485-1 [Araneus ventricosus]
MIETLLSYDEDAPVSEIIKRLRNIVNGKQIDHPHLTDKKVEIGNSLLDVLVFKCTQMTEKFLLNAEATLQQNEKDEQNITFPQVQEIVRYSDDLRGKRKPHTTLVYPAMDSSKATSILKKMDSSKATSILKKMDSSNATSNSQENYSARSQR